MVDWKRVRLRQDLTWNAKNSTIEYMFQLVGGAWFGESQVKR
jgi:hypothetical protein